MCIWEYSSFWPTTKAEILNVKYISLHQLGYTAEYVAPSFRGGASHLTIPEYEYRD